MSDPWALVEAGRYEEAVPLLRAEAEATEATEGAEAWDTAVAFNQLGVACKFAGRYDEAAAAYARALPVAEADDDPALLATLLHNLGGLAHSRGRPDEAEAYARRGLELRRGRCDDPLAVAADAAALASILETRDEWDEAEELYRDSLAAYEDAGDAYEAAMTRNGLAAVLRFAGRPAEAEPMFREALSEMERERGSDHPETATVRNNLAMLLNATDRPVEALPLLEQAAADLNAVLGPSHPATTDIVANRDRIATRLRTGIDPGPPG